MDVEFNPQKWVDFHLPQNEGKPKNILIIGNTKNFFGEIVDGEYSWCNTTQEVIANNYIWLEDEIANGSKIWVLGENKLIQRYYQYIWGHFKPDYVWMKNNFKHYTLENFAKKFKIKYNKSDLIPLYEETLNFLIRESNIRYNTIIVNPPYSTRTHRDLELKILQKCIFLLRDNYSKCMGIAPVNWLVDPFRNFKNNSSASVKFKTLERRISNIDLVYEKSLCADAPLGVYTLQKRKVDYTFPSNICRSILTKVASYCDNNPIPLEKRASSNWRVEWKSQYNFDPAILGSKALKNLSYSYNGDYPLSIRFNSEEECKNFCESAKTKFCLFFQEFSLNENRGRSIHERSIPWMYNYSESWTDDKFYKYFNLSSEEVNYIEEFIKKFPLWY